MSALISCTSTNSVGCTFLDWSINYLAGKTQIYNYQEGWVSLTNNPLAGMNAHLHTKNHPAGLAEIQNCVARLKQNTDFATLYPISLHIDTVAKLLGMPVTNISSEDLIKINQYRADDFNAAMTWLNQNNSKIIFVSNKLIPIYSYNVRTLERMYHCNQPASGVDEMRSSFDMTFFDVSAKSKWDSEYIWDLREKRALDIRPFAAVDSMDLTIPHYWVDCQELWFNGESVINDIMQYIVEPIDSTRFEIWRAVYLQWQRLQAKNAKFSYTYQHIVEAIVNNWDYAIDLTFDEEVVIQHCLIYQHGLNLKTWQLEKFPNNTQQLHTLLEPNLHDLTK
jgi:hypothetical protein